VESLRDLRFPSILAATVRRLRLTDWTALLGMVCLIVIGLPFLMRGWNAWQDDAAVRDTVAQFFQAVADGRKDDALTYFSDGAKYALAVQGRDPAADDWKPTGELSVRCSAVTIDADEAVARLVITKDNFTLKPTVSLCRKEAGPWRIKRIDGNVVDPRWPRLQESRRREADETLADELTGKLQASETAKQPTAP
jgi:hypothetical protein